MNPRTRFDIRLIAFVLLFVAVVGGGLCVAYQHYAAERQLAESERIAAEANLYIVRATLTSQAPTVQPVSTVSLASSDTLSDRAAALVYGGIFIASIGATVAKRSGLKIGLPRIVKVKEVRNLPRPDMSMNGQAAQALRHIVERYKTTDWRRVNALMMDVAPTYHRERFVIVQAARNGVPNRLRRAARMPRVVMVGQCIRVMVESTAIDANAARWAVEAWCFALGHDEKA